MKQDIQKLIEFSLSIYCLNIYYLYLFQSILEFWIIRYYISKFQIISFVLWDLVSLRYRSILNNYLFNIWYNLRFRLIRFSPFNNKYIIFLKKPMAYYNEKFGIKYFHSHLDITEPTLSLSQTKRQVTKQGNRPLFIFHFSFYFCQHITELCRLC